jgi:hypothetical protein
MATGSVEVPPAYGGILAPDFELGQVRPRLVGFGMGPYEDFFGADDAAGRLLDDQIDQLRAYNLSYGHAAAWWVRNPAGGEDEPLSEAEQAKEYFIGRAFQTRTLDAGIEAVRYIGANGAARDLSTALTQDMDLANARLELRYDNGVYLWLNHGGPVWSVDLGPEVYDLPRSGWLATGPDGFLAYSARVEGRRVDYLATADYTLMDGRGHETLFGTESATDLKVVFADGRVLTEGAGGRLTMSPP